MKQAVICLAVLALVFPLLADDAKSPIKAGKWETTIEMEIPGAPMKMPPVKFTTCISKEQAENPENSVPKSMDKKSECKVSDLKITGNKVSYTVTCKNNMSMDAEMKYSDDSYEGTMKMRLEGAPEMTHKYSGKRLGDCDPATR
ncbi:MAG TPA: DUF3617 family protein [Thermoanaerobaculia bacterium]|nr:DUF3617 family protein [Thermoanaerobaculia bacterium]